MKVLGEPMTETSCPVSQQPLAWAIVQQEVLVRNIQLTSYQQPGRIWERSKEETPVHMSYQSSRIRLTEIHLGSAMPVPPVRTLSQSGWLETTQKLTPSREDFALRGRAVLLVTYPLALLPGTPFPYSLCFVSMCVPSDNSFPSVTKPTLRTWRGPIFLQHSDRTISGQC